MMWGGEEPTGQGGTDGWGPARGAREGTEREDNDRTRNKASGFTSTPPPPRRTSWGSSPKHPQADPGPHLLCAREEPRGDCLPGLSFTRLH